VFICAALAFKVSAVPFHMWTPDVYEGAPTPVTAFFSTGPKIAALALLVRVLREPLLALSAEWVQVMVFAAIASMLIGSFAGLQQKNLKRLMAYSSIANVGYALTGLAVMSKAGLSALLIYLAVYFLNTLGTFGVILCLRRDGKPVENLSDLAGLSKTNPMLALAMTMFMFSLAGVPPLAGFFGKYFIFLSAVQANMVPLAVFGVLTSVVAAFYYLRIIKVMYFDDATAPIDALPDFGVKLGVAVAAVYMLAFTIYPSPVVDAARAAVDSFIH
jgi:NADH-quinone oxidoreductase subunit N